METLGLAKGTLLEDFDVSLLREDLGTLVDCGMLIEDSGMLVADFGVPVVCSILSSVKDEDISLEDWEGGLLLTDFDVVVPLTGFDEAVLLADFDVVVLFLLLG